MYVFAMCLNLSLCFSTCLMQICSHSGGYTFFAADLSLFTADLQFLGRGRGHGGGVAARGEVVGSHRPRGGEEETEKKLHICHKMANLLRKTVYPPKKTANPLNCGITKTESQNTLHGSPKFLIQP